MPAAGRPGKTRSEGKSRAPPKDLHPPGKASKHTRLVVGCGVALLAAVLRYVFLASCESRLAAAARDHRPLEAKALLEAFEECSARDGCASLADVLGDSLPLDLPRVDVDPKIAQSLDSVLAAVLSDNMTRIRAEGFHDIVLQSASRQQAFKHAWSLAHSTGPESESQLSEAVSHMDGIAIAKLWTRTRFVPTNSEQFELFFRRVRAALLRMGSGSSGKLPDGAVSVAAALGCQAAKTEWMWAASHEEEKHLASLTLSQTSPSVELYSMYRPLLSHPAFANLTIDGAKDRIGLLTGHHDALFQQQLVDPLLEKDLAANLPVLVAPQENTSSVVQDMYEADPYPRWESLPNPDWPRTFEGFLQKAAGAAAGSLPTIGNVVLVLGCGTGLFANGFARFYPSVAVTAVDLSSSSLGFAARKASELALSNLNLAKADLLGLTLANNSFDMIESSGVLHHLEDPHRGLAVVARLLKPGGVALLALYSRVARRTLDKVHSWIKHAAPGRPYNGSQRGDLRRFRQDVLDIKPHSPWADMKKWLLGTGDFWSLSRVRDLVFHPMEHRYKPSDLRPLLEKHGMRFLRFAPWAVPAEKRKRWRSRYGSEPSEDSDLSRWTKFEEDNPDTFQGMLVFFAQKGGV